MTRRHLVECDGCGAEATVLDATDLPPSWAAVVQGGAIRHYCPDCVPCLPADVVVAAYGRGRR